MLVVNKCSDWPCCLCSGSWSKSDFEPEELDENGTFGTWRGGERFRQAYADFRKKYPVVVGAILHILGTLRYSRTIYRRE